MAPNWFAFALVVGCSILAHHQAQGSILPAFLSFGSNDAVATGATSRQQAPPTAASQQQQQHQQQQQQQQVAAVDSTPAQNSSSSRQQPAAAPPAAPIVNINSANSLQAHLNALQAQAQRHLNGLVLTHSPATNQSQKLASSVLETLHNVGKAIHQQIRDANQHVQIVPLAANGAIGAEPVDARKNEYQSIVGPSAEQQPALMGIGANQSSSNVNYREQGEQLRQEIVRRAGQLQLIVAQSMDLLKNNGDLIVRRLLEQMNVRLDQAKAKADKIINEPATNEVAVRALGAINLGLNNLNNIITNIVARLDLASRELNQVGTNVVSSIQQRGAGQQPAAAPVLLDATNKFKMNLQQLGQQFHSALNASQLHQQLLAMARQRQALAAAAQQQQAPTELNSNNRINLDFKKTR